MNQDRWESERRIRAASAKQAREKLGHAVRARTSGRKPGGGPEALGSSRRGRARSGVVSGSSGRGEGPAARQRSREPVRKGAHTSYKARDKKTKQSELFPKLLEEIEKKRQERRTGKHFSAEDRFGDEFRSELSKIAVDLIGGTPEEQTQFFDSDRGVPGCVLD